MRFHALSLYALPRFEYHAARHHEDARTTAKPLKSAGR